MAEEELGRACNFYEEVDERMSRESTEYPLEQAKYVGEWLEHSLNNETYLNNGDLWLDTEPGNVVGIRGFNLAKELEQQDELNRLRRDHKALRSKYSKLLSKFLEKVNEHFDENHNRIEGIKVLISSRETCQECKGETKCKSESKCAKCLDQEKSLCAAQKRRELEAEVHNLRRELSSMKDSNDESILQGLNERIRLLQSEIATKDSKIAELSQQVNNLFLESKIERANRLDQENANYLKIESRNSEQFAKFHRYFSNLETRIEVLDKEFDEGCKTTDKQTRELMTELFRLQVDYSKMKHLLDVETKVKLSLQRKCECLQQENEELDRRLERQTHETNLREQRDLARDQNECDRMRRMISDLQVKCRDLETEKRNQEEVLKSCEEERANSRLHAIKEQSKIKDAYQLELDEVREKLAISEDKKRKLLDEFERLSSELANSENENEKMLIRLGELQAQVDTKPTVITDGQYLRAIENLSDKIQAAELTAAKLKSDLDATKSELEFRQLKYNDLKKKYDIQSASLNSANLSRERELTKLRVDLNYERYNRQVTVRGLENELNSTFKELEFMRTKLAISNMSNIRSKRCKDARRDLVDDQADRKIDAQQTEDKMDTVVG